MIEKTLHLQTFDYFSNFLNFFKSLIIIFLILFSFASKGNAQCTVVANAGADKTVCQGTNTTLTATASGGTSPYYYDWSGSTSGLNYAYYTGVWSTLPNFNTLTPASTGTVSNFDISMATAADYYALKFWGKINISTAGTYTFYTSSDDGSKLYIDGNLIVNNDGEHAVQEKSGTVVLTAGLHFIEVQYFERKSASSLIAKYAGPSISKQTIPNGVLTTAGTLSGDNKIYPNTSGSYTVTVTDSKGCTATDVVAITVPGSSANAGTDIYQCNNANFTLDATTPSVGSGTWSKISGTGIITTPTSPTTTVTGVTAGTSTSLIWTITSSGCPAADTVLVANNLATSPACACETIYGVTGSSSSFTSFTSLKPLNISTGQFGTQFGSNLSIVSAAICWDTLNKKMYYVDVSPSTTGPSIYAMNSLGASVNTV